VARTVLITNPAAARTDVVAAQAVAETFRRGGWAVELRATGGPGDARRFAEEAVADGVDLVSVFGGDGTTMQAAAALVGRETTLAVIPGGTGNLLAGNLRIPTHPVRAARALLRGRVVSLDLGRIERADGEHFFAVACGAGYDARVMAETSTADKHRWRFAAYVATTLRLMPELKSIGHVFTESVRAVWELLREGGTTAGGPGRVAYARGRVITVEAAAAQPVQLDGEPHGRTPFTAEVVPGAIRILRPGPA
jgi:diacylglycerol kinase family enzyme